MVLKIDIQAPGVELFIRPLDEELVGEARHFRLKPADWLRSEYNLNALINTTLYFPSEWWESYPGAKVRSLESLVYAGKQSHLHDHSYLVGLTRSNRILFDTAKPPHSATIQSMIWGFGVQAIQLREGKVLQGTLDGSTNEWALTAIGCNQSQTHLFLAAHQRTDKASFLEDLVSLGVWNGALMDSGSAANFVLDGTAAHLGAFRGVRGLRPIGAFLGLRAKPLKP